MNEPIYTSDHEREAFELGADAGRAAASWVIDGDTSAEHVVRVLAMLDDGDPQAYDYLPAEPNLSGEWADAPTPASLYEDVTGLSPYEPFDEDDNEATATMEELCDAWEAGVSSTFESECERILRAALPEPEDTSEEPCTEYGLEVCPDCGNGGIKIDATGYVDCTRFLTCWTDSSHIV